jgi:hypothetical protein
MGIVVSRLAKCISMFATGKRTRPETKVTAGSDIDTAVSVSPCMHTFGCAVICSCGPFTIRTRSFVAFPFEKQIQTLGSIGCSVGYPWFDDDSRTFGRNECSTSKDSDIQYMVNVHNMKYRSKLKTISYSLYYKEYDNLCSIKQASHDQ